MAIVYMEFVVFTTNGYLADKQHSSSMIIQRSDSVFIGPESDHWLCLSLTNYLTDSCLVELMAVNDTNCLILAQQLLKAFSG